MLAKLWILLILVLSPPLAFAQVGQSSIEAELELVSMLCTSPDEQSRGNLLKSHPQLVNSELWMALSKRAVADYYGQRPERSLTTYEIALQVAHRLQSPKLLGTTYYNMGRSYSGLNQLSKAIEAYERSKGIFEHAGLRQDLTYILADLGRLYFILENYQKARSYSEESLALADSAEVQALPATSPEEYIRATALATLADLHLRDGEYDQAIQKIRVSLALHQKLSSRSSYYNTFVADDLQTLGRVYTASGDYTQALAYLNRALNIVKNLSDPTGMANLLNSIGVLYLEQEDYAQAKNSLDASLQIYLSINKQREVSEVLLNLGVIEQRQSNYDQALSLFQRSLQRAKATKAVDVEIAAGEGIGVVLTAKKNFTLALEALNASLGIAKVTTDRTRQTELLWRLAEAYSAMGDYASGVAFAESAVALARSSNLPKLRYLATTTLGKSFAAQKKFELATQTLKQAVEQVERMRDQVAGRDVAVQLFFENKVNAYHALVDLLIEQDKPLDALLYAERAKGRVLLDVLRGGKPDLAKVLTAPEKAEGQRLNRKVSEINDSIKKQEGANSLSLNSLYAQLDAARLEYQSFQDAVYVSHPNLSVRSGRTAVLTTADVDSLTQNNEMGYLEYVVGKDRVSLFVVTKDKTTGLSDLNVYILAIKPEDLVRKVNQFHDMLSNQRPTYASAARELYGLLIEPAEQQLSGVGTICIVPDSFLWNVPFQALMTPNEHFLIEDHAVYYAPSLSVLTEMNRKRATSETPNSSLIAFGNPVIGKDEQRNADLCPLPEAEQEVISIAKSFDEKNTRVFIGRDATEKSFKDLASRYSVVHLATHGVIDNRQPIYSHLVLTKTEGDPENDGRLEARQIMDMNLRADLAVLSACETANGRIAPGEGVIGMSWAFFVAGARTVVVSQWKVSSASTSELMSNFYSSLNPSRGEPNFAKTKALREASLLLISDKSYRHPFYWAGFVMVGNGY